MWLFGCAGKNNTKAAKRGIAGDHITWSYDKKSKTLTFTGGGEMTIDKYFFKDYKIKNVVFDDEITFIQESLLSWHNELDTPVKLPAKLKRIGSFAFYGSGITGDLVIPDSVKIIEQYAFANCAGLDGRLVLSASLEVIGDSAFEYCESLKGELIFPEGLTGIGNAAFNHCSSFTGGLVIPKGITELKRYTFAWCSSMDGELRISENVTVIEMSCFDQCTSLKGNLVIPEGVMSIGERAFAGCGFDGEIKLPESLEQLDAYAFSNMVKLKGIVTFPGKIETIPSGCFIGCSAIEGVVFSDNLKYISDEAFNACRSLRGELVLPDGLIVLGDQAFQMCENITGRLILPEGLTSVGQDCFYDCGITAVEFPDSLVNIKSFAFDECDKLTGKIVIPNNVTVLGEAAFRGCSGIKKVVIGKGIMSIGKSAFAKCTSLAAAEFEGLLPDYYSLSEEKPSFPEGCELIYDKSVNVGNSMFESWKDCIGKSQSITENGSSAESGADNVTDSSDEVPYYWTEGLNDDFRGLGKYGDMKIEFKGSTAIVYVNGRELDSAAFTADANSADRTIHTDGVYTRSGKVVEMELVYLKSGNKAIKCNMELFDGGMDEIVFLDCSEEYWYFGLAE